MWGPPFLLKKTTKPIQNKSVMGREDTSEIVNSTTVLLQRALLLWLRLMYFSQNPDLLADRIHCM